MDCEYHIQEAVTKLNAGYPKVSRSIIFMRYISVQFIEYGRVREICKKNVKIWTVKYASISHKRIGKGKKFQHNKRQ